MTDIDEIVKKIEAIEKLDEEKARLLKKLKYSIALQKFEPRAFESGSCKTRVQGNLKHNFDSALFIIGLSSGEDIEHKLIDVPVELWPEEAVKAYKSAYPWKNKIPKGGKT
jgi:hypothetical protein